MSELANDFNSFMQNRCSYYKPIYNKLIRKYGGGGTTEKDF